MFPTLAAPGTAWMLIFFGIPLFAVVAVGAGKVDAIFRTPVPVWNPFEWDAGPFLFAVEQLISPSGIFHVPMLRTIAYTVIAVACCLLIGYPVAYTVSRHGGKYKGLLLALLLAPFFISYLMRMLAWVNLLRDDGLVNTFLMNLGIIGTPYPWLDGRPVTVIFGLIYGYIPYTVLPLYAGLDLIDRDLLSAARDLGATRRATFRKVTWPLSRPAVLAAVLITGLPILGDYYTNDLLSASPRTTMIANQIDFLLHAQNSGPTIGAALVMVLMLILIPALVYYLRVSGESVLREVEAEGPG